MAQMGVSSTQKGPMVVVESSGGSPVVSLTSAKGGLSISSQPEVLKGVYSLDDGRFSS